LNHFSFTGLIILTLSRRFAQEMNQPRYLAIRVDLKPALDHQKPDERLLREINENGNRQMQNTIHILLPASMVDACLE